MSITNIRILSMFSSPGSWLDDWNAVAANSKRTLNRFSDLTFRNQRRGKLLARLTWG